jgi:hypothetical protein
MISSVSEVDQVLLRSIRGKQTFLDAVRQTYLRSDSAGTHDTVLPTRAQFMAEKATE